MKKPAILSILLIALFTFAIVSGCAQDKEDPLLPEEDDSLLMEYYDCVILQDREVVTPFRYAENTALADAVLDKIKAAEEKFGCTISLEHLGPTSVAENANVIVAGQASGNCVGDIFFGDSMTNYLIAAADNFLPLPELKEYLDYENADKFGAANILELAVYHGVPYAVAPMKWPDQFPNMRDVFFVNTKLSRETFSQNDPREYVENGTWDKDNFEQFIVNTTASENGVTTIYGLVGGSKYFMQTAILNSGVNFLTRDTDGNYRSELNSPASVSAVTWIQNLMNNHKDSFKLFLESPGEEIDMFVAGDATTLLMSTWGLVQTICFEVDEFAVMPFPKLCDAENSGWVTAYQSAFMSGVPINASEPEYSAMIIDELFNPFTEYPDKDALKNYYQEQFFHDPRDVDVMFKLIDNTYYCYSYVGAEDYMYTIAGALGSGTASELLSKFDSTISNIIEEYIEPNYQFMADHGFRN